jgi:hypothetical protein
MVGVSAVTVIDLRSHGYAPGAYECVCSDCDAKFTGDKRAWRCATCALNRAQGIVPSANLAEILRIYEGSNGAETTGLYLRLEEQLGQIGGLAVNLFRAQKASERAKKYRGGNGHGSYRAQAYERKQWALDNLCAALSDHAAEAGVAWGWGEDSKQPVHKAVLYIDLPTGQVSFHTSDRGEGPSYPGQWDGIRDASAVRILRWIARLLDAAQAPAKEAAE